VLIASAIAIQAQACRRDPAPQGAVASDACPAEWLQAPPADTAIAVPPGGGRVVFHAAAQGSQDYTCRRTEGDGGAAYAWTFTGPEATLSDCRGAPVGRHFASDAGAGAPEWSLSSGEYVVGHKLAAWTPPGGAGGSVPWLLIGTDGRGGDGPLARARYVVRATTHGGVAPAEPCDATRSGAAVKVPYTADYFFYAP